METTDSVSTGSTHSLTDTDDDEASFFSQSAASFQVQTGGIVVVRQSMATTESSANMESLQKSLDLLHQVVQKLTSKVETLQTDISQVRTDISQVRTDISQLQTDISEVRTDISQLQTEVRTDISQLQKKMHRMNAKVIDLDKRMLRTNSVLTESSSDSCAEMLRPADTSEMQELVSQQLEMKAANAFSIGNDLVTCDRPASLCGVKDSIANTVEIIGAASSSDDEKEEEKRRSTI